MNYKSRLFEFIGVSGLNLKVNVYINMEFKSEEDEENCDPIFCTQISSASL
jgi:hypothetical protein